MTRHIRVLGVPTDFGTDRRGVDMGPSAIRYAGLIEELNAITDQCIDAGNINHVQFSSPHDHDTDDTTDWVTRTAAVSKETASWVQNCLNNEDFPVVLGGDHSITIGTLTGTSANATTGVIWLDAHADFNTPETSPTGNIHGMPLAAVLGRGSFDQYDWATAPNIPESNIVWVGLRDLDPAERTAIKSSDATAFTMSDIDNRGISSVITEALETASENVDAFHVSLDMDFLDPNEAPGVGTPVQGGVTYREAHLVLEQIASFDAEHELLRSLDLVEVNPILDNRNKTAKLATELTASALGKRIL